MGIRGLHASSISSVFRVFHVLIKFSPLIAFTAFFSILDSVRFPGLSFQVFDLSEQLLNNSMIGSFLTRVSIMILGYAYPAYECYRVVEKNKPEIEHLRFWCQYWIIVALLTIFERFGDAFISWLPMYGEVKLAFFVYLWHPRIKGTTYIYETYLQSYMSRHEREIDHNLLELRTKAADFALLYWQKALKNCRSWFFDVALCVLLQSSTTRLCPVQAENAPAVFPTENEQAENTQHSEPLKTEPTKHSTRKKAGLVKAGSPRSPAIASSKSGQGSSPAGCSPACLPTLHEDACVHEEDVTVDENDSSLRHKERDAMNEYARRVCGRGSKLLPLAQVH